jgi:hypothetical protein
MLLDRKQFVNYNNCKSYIFVNDLSQNIDWSTPQFADDLVAINIILIYYESSIQTLQKDLNKILNYTIEIN